MNAELASMLAMGARLARGMGASEEEVAAVVVSEAYLLDIRRQVANLHADIAELEIRMRDLEKVTPRKNGGLNGDVGNGHPR
jgi:hypothetical protein